MPDAAVFSAAPHIVDQLILERAPGLLSDPLARCIFCRLLLKPLRYDEAKAMADIVRDLPGREIMDLVSRELALGVHDDGLPNLPASGPAILVANHPTGLADGVAVWDSVKRRRADMRFLVNGDAIRVAPGLNDVMIPIELSPTRRNRAASREALIAVEDAIARGQLLIVFPSGRLAYLGWCGLRERVWLPSVLSIARRYDLPIMPLHIRARNSAAFYILSQLGRELRDVTLFSALLNKRGRSFRLAYGTPLSTGDLPADSQRAIRWLQHHVEHILPLEAEARHWDMAGGARRRHSWSELPAPQ